ncbi:pyridoxamine 5'-phosphate oxidase family protein [Halomonas cupida]|uniref:pyridoxamine 5'-phosphate oxidase family protein n=1 Tax=Halomonas cupida TaxID=44933 RepID=UPI003A94EA76
MNQLKVTERTTIKRGPKRTSLDRESAWQMIDQALICHVAQQVDGQVVVTPTCHWRDGDYLYWHGHRRARNLAADQPVSINICALDGLVMARSAFHHSINYRSLTVFGTAEWIEDEEHKAQQLQRFVDKVSPGRWEQLRPMTRQELAATGVVRVALDEVSFKCREGGPNDDEADAEWPVWAGVIHRYCHWEPEQDPQQGAVHEMPRVRQDLVY